MLACDSPEAISTVNSMLFRIQVQMRTDTLHGSDKLPAGKVGLHNPQELGYAYAAPKRGCAGKAQFGETAFAFAYTIRPSDDDKDKHVVAGARMEIVKARCSQIDAAGNFANKAEPVGRDNLEELEADLDNFFSCQTDWRVRSWIGINAKLEEFNRIWSALSGTSNTHCFTLWHS
ncbi:hypothetical protein [Janthinobacterium sp. 17J80-10]|uniref:hypothetical protein n=1 Tax=Janthinobacterium sp. 17J80-10 TaxID=2497863 RepID=UPI0010057548|nr:hypothetical protein [Janthinobacterium sp. 17J80-10]QAU34205.1 hypothetical protein EKL02_08405 [Janthinobacterium sp. 17J80-10]